MSFDRSNEDPRCFSPQTAPSGYKIRFNAYRSLTQIFWRIVGTTPGRADLGTRKPDFLSPQLAAAVAHPTRIQAMSILCERIASPRELAAAIGEPLNNVTYHVNQLRDLGCIELARTERAHGGRVLERFYRPTRQAYFDDEAWEMLSEKERLGVMAAIVGMISKDLAEAMASGSFFADDDKHVSRWSTNVDEAGWREIAALLERTGKEIFEIEDRSAGRAASGGSAAIRAKVALMQFRSPPRES
jgi:DNA-binding transcriptional ArsR family regulator